MSFPIVTNPAGPTASLPSVDLTPFTVTPVGLATNGQPLYDIRATDGTDIIAHNDSGDNDAWSGDSQWLALRTTSDGRWWALRRDFSQIHELSNHSLNRNTIWSGVSGDEYFRIDGNQLLLQRMQVGNQTPLTSVPIPTSLAGPDGGPITPSIYECLFSSQKPQHALAVHDASNDGNMGILRFDPVTLAFDTIWWVRNALSAGGLPIQRRLHNVEVGLGGIVGAIQSNNNGSDTHQAWIPFDGSTANRIEPVLPQAPNPYSHQAYEGLDQIAGKPTGMVVSRFGLTPSVANETEICTVSYTDLQNLNDTVGETDTAYQHGHLVPGQRGTFTMRAAGSNTRSVAYIDYSLGDCHTEIIHRGLLNDGDFYGGGRSSVSQDFSNVAWHERSNGQTYVRVTGVRGAPRQNHVIYRASGEQSETGKINSYASAADFGNAPEVVSGTFYSKFDRSTGQLMSWIADPTGANWQQVAN